VQNVYFQENQLSGTILDSISNWDIIKNYFLNPINWLELCQVASVMH